MAGTIVRARSLFEAAIVKEAILDSFRKLGFRRQARNPVMFVVYVGSILTTLLWLQALVGQGEAPGWFIFWVSVWLWFTVLFANFAEAMAEGRGKAQAASLRKARRRDVGRLVQVHESERKAEVLVMESHSSEDMIRFGPLEAKSIRQTMRADLRPLLLGRTARDLPRGSTSRRTPICRRARLGEPPGPHVHRRCCLRRVCDGCSKVREE